MILSSHKYCIYDLDGSLSNSSHRVHLAQSKQWDAFNELLSLDKPHEPIASLLKLTSRSARNIILTGRDVKYIQPTMDWLFEHDLSPYISDIIMRPSDCWIPDHELKIQLLDVYFENREIMLEKIWFVVDDREKVVEAMRNIGLTVLQPCAGAY